MEHLGSHYQQAAVFLVVRSATSSALSCRFPFHGPCSDAVDIVCNALCSFPSLQMRFVVCASLEKVCLTAAITANLERFARLYAGEKRVVILQIDEIATDPRARYYGLTDEVRIWNFET